MAPSTIPAAFGNSTSFNTDRTPMSRAFPPPNTERELHDRDCPATPNLERVPAKDEQRRAHESLVLHQEMQQCHNTDSDQ